MKKTVAIVLLMLLILPIFCIVGCSKNAYKAVTSQLQKTDLEVQHYNETQINQIKVQMNNFGITLGDEIKNIDHYIKTVNGKIEFIYVYEFENENDAKALYDWASIRYTTKIFDNVVAYGNALALNSIEVE